MRYIVSHNFRDLRDRSYLYRVGDEYPRAGRAATPERIAELLSGKNKAKLVLIEEVKEAEDKPKTAKKTTKKKTAAKKAAKE